jgi:hypothetical protein
MINNVGFAMAVEKLLGLTGKLPRARRVHPRDRQRDLADHRPPDLRRRVRDGAGRVHAVSVLPQGARVALRLLEKVSGARLTHSYVRIGGVVKDLPEGLARRARLQPGQIEREVMVECEAMLNGNKIFRDRMAGVGAMTRQDALRLRLHRADRARRRRRLRRPQGLPVLGLSRARVRRPGRHHRRLLRPLPGPHRGDQAVDPDPASVHRSGSPSWPDHDR